MPTRRATRPRVEARTARYITCMCVLTGSFWPAILAFEPFRERIQVRKNTDRGTTTTRSKEDSRIALETIRRLVVSGYSGPAWHGPSLRAVLRGATPEDALRRAGPGRNTIWELLLHVAYTRHRLTGRIARVMGTPTPRSFPRRLRAAWWPMLPDAARGTDAERRDAWRADLALLADCQTRLLDAVDGAGPAVLRRRRSGVRWTIADEIAALAVHDAYHAGQIRLIRLSADE